MKAFEKVKILRNKFQKQVSLGHRVFMLRLDHCKKLLLHVHFGCWAWKVKRIHSGIVPAHLHGTWTSPGPYLDLSSSGPTSYQFQEVPCECKAYLDPSWDRSQIYPVPCKWVLFLRLNLSASWGGKCLNWVYRHPLQLSTPEIPTTVPPQLQPIGWKYKQYLIVRK